MNGLPDWEWYDDGLPWLPVKPVSVMLETQPTLFFGEILIITFAVISFFHAVAHGRQHVLIWFTSVITGTANDIFFMVLPFVDNCTKMRSSDILSRLLPLSHVPQASTNFNFKHQIQGWRLVVSLFTL